MKVLLLSCSTGEGHNSAAKAVCETLTANGVECEIKDPVSFNHEKSPKRVAKAYNNLIKKAPAAFGAVYKIGACYEATRLPSPIYSLNAKYAEKLNNYIVENKFDAVVTSHLYGMEALTAIKRAHPDHVPFFGIITDYTVIPFTRDTDLDEYFIPHSDLIIDFEKKKMRVDNLIATCIPVSPRFRTEISKEDARRTLGLPVDKKIVLIMSGGVGCESINPLVRMFRKEGVKPDRFYCVLAGNNEKLKNKISKTCPKEGVVAVGFTDKVHLYLKAADVVISKSGGLSSTEVAVAGVPVVHFKPIPGCETYNARFFHAKNMSQLAKNAQGALEKAEKLLDNEKERVKMVEAQRAEINRYGADDIARHVIEKCSASRDTEETPSTSRETAPDDNAKSE